MKVLTNDPSVTAWGWAVIDYRNGKAHVLDSGCIKTEPSPKKLRIRKSDDTVRRLEEITRELLEVRNRHQIDWVVSEAPHGSQNASAAKMIGAVAGLMSAFSIVSGLPIEWYSEGDTKKHVLGKRSATKKEMVDCIISIYGGKWYRDIKYKDEAVADALAVFHFAQATSPALKFMSNNSSPHITRTR